MYRNKNELDAPILTGFSNLFHYHMGTVALGSLLIALLQFVRSLLRFVDVRFNFIIIIIIIIFVNNVPQHC